MKILKDSLIDYKPNCFTLPKIIKTISQNWLLELWVFPAE